MDYIKELVASAGVNLLMGIIILIVGLFLVHWIMKFIKHSDFIKKLDPSLASFFSNAINLILTVIVVLTAANKLGVPLTSIITIFASAGVAVSLGMQGALGNLVGGVMLLILRPIKVGEFVKIGEHVGMVKTIGAFYTEIRKKDGTLISIPNSSLTNAAIVNFSREGNRRVAVSFQLGYDCDIDRVCKVLKEMAMKSDLVIKDPQPKVILDELGDSGMIFEVRAWTPAENFSKVRKFLVLNGKKALDEAGIPIAYQQVDVHVRQD